MILLFIDIRSLKAAFTFEALKTNSSSSRYFKLVLSCVAGSFALRFHSGDTILISLKQVDGN